MLFIISDGFMIRVPRTAGYSSTGSSANAGASATAFSSAGTSVFPGPGGTLNNK